MSTPIKLPHPPTPQPIDIDACVKQMTEEFTGRLAEAIRYDNNSFPCLLNKPMADAAMAAGYTVHLSPHPIETWGKDFNPAIGAGFKEYIVSWSRYITPANQSSEQKPFTLDDYHAVPGSRSTQRRGDLILPTLLIEAPNGRRFRANTYQLANLAEFAALLKSEIGGEFTGSDDDLRKIRVRLKSEAAASPV
jgi:hypothetical protein